MARQTKLGGTLLTDALVVRMVNITTTGLEEVLVFSGLVFDIIGIGGESVRSSALVAMSWLSLRVCLGMSGYDQV